MLQLVNARYVQSRKKALEHRLNKNLLHLIPVSAKILGFLKFYLPTLNVLQLLGQTWFIGGLNYVWGFLSFIRQFFKIHINPFKAFGVLKSNKRNTFTVKHWFCAKRSHPLGAVFGLRRKTVWGEPPVQCRGTPSPFLKGSSSHVPETSLQSGTCHLLTVSQRGHG